MSEFRTVAEAIIQQAGGLDNITSATHCMTRLRLEVRDESLLNREGIQNVDMVKGLNKVGDQYQVILGTGIVNKVYKEVEKIFQENNKVLESGKSGGPLLQRISRLFGDIFIPVIPVIVASGILMGVRTFLTESGMLGTSGAWYTVLSVLIDTGFSFLPALVAYSAAKKFGGNPLYGFVLGLMLLSSSLPAGGAVGKGNAELLQVPFFGLFTISVKGYQGSVMVAMVAGYFVSLFERLWRKVVPNVVDMILTPILTLACSFFLILFGVGPIIQMVEAGLLQFFLAVLELPLGLGGFICGALQQVLVITGMHHGLWFIDINMLAETGRNFYQPIRNAGMMGQAGACIAFALMAKDRKLRTNTAAASVSALFGITEPAIFGSNLIYLMPFVFGCIGGGFAGMFATWVNLSAPGMGAGCIPGLLYYIGNTGALAEYVISSLIAAGIGFVLTALFIKKKGI